MKTLINEKHIFSNKDIAALIIPLVIEQLLVITLGFADILMVAVLGEESVSAVALGDSINLLINGLFAALATGGSVVCARYFGGKNSKMISLSAKQLIYTTVSISLVITILGLCFQGPLLHLVFGHIEDVVMTQANTYFFYSLLSYPLIALYSAASALFRAQGNSRVSMFSALIVNILNIGGNAFCIFGLKTGVEGVAIPTLFARGLAALLLMILLYRARPYRGRPAVVIKGLSHIRFDFRIIKNILGIGVPNGIENSVFQIGKILVLTLMAEFGTGAVAANAAAATLVSFNVLPGVAMGLALITVIGQALGQGSTDEAVYWHRKLMILTYIMMIILNIPMLIFTKQLIGLFNLKPETAGLCMYMYLFHNICGLAIWPVSFTMPASLRAANDAKFTMTVSILSMWIVRVGLSYIFARLTPWGPMSIWYAMVIDWCVRSSAFIIRWKRGKWKLHYNFT
jgi:putative MATE family efflux protein